MSTAVDFLLDTETSKYDELEYDATLILPWGPQAWEVLLSHYPTDHDATNLYQGYSRVVLTPALLGKLRALYAQYTQLKETHRVSEIEFLPPVFSQHFSFQPHVHLLRRVARDFSEAEDLDYEFCHVNELGVRWSYHGRKEDACTWNTASLPGSALERDWTTIPAAGVVVASWCAGA